MQSSFFMLLGQVLHRVRTEAATTIIATQYSKEDIEFVVVTLKCLNITAKALYLENGSVIITASMLDGN